jgi:hypothetical protein
MFEQRTRTRIRTAARRRRTLLLPLLVLLCAAILPVASASAIVVTLHDGTSLSYQPLRGARAFSTSRFDALFTNLDYNGGPVMPSNTNFTIYWRPAGFATQYPVGYEGGVDRYLQDLAHDSGGHENVDSVSTQYNDAAGEFAEYESHFGGARIDTDAYPANGCTRAAVCLTDLQIREELVKFVKEQGLPTDLTHEYFLLTPPEVESCFEAGEATQCSAGSAKPVYCAYHSNIPTEGGELIYANDPFVTGNAGCDDNNHPNESPSDGALEGGLSHEHNESITDPEPNNAWTDFGGETGEIGDKCENEMGTPVGETGTKQKYNQVINGDFYWYQEEWSNQGHKCMQRLTFSGVRPTATFTATPGSGEEEVILNAEGSTAPPEGVLSYNWQPNLGGEPGEPFETFSPSVGVVFPENGAYRVALTVFAKNGTSIGTAGTVFVTVPTAAFSFVPASPVAGATVSFDGRASTPNFGSISSYRWSFGDGGSGEGATTAHPYAAPGLYPVTLNVTNTTGFNASAMGFVEVSAPPPAPPPVAPPLVSPPPAAAPAPPPAVPPPAAVPAAPSATVSLSGTALTVKSNGQSTVKLKCVGNASCSGELTLTAKQHYKSGGKNRTRTVKIASAKFSVPAGRTTTVNIKLNSTGRNMLKSAHGTLNGSLQTKKSKPAPAQNFTMSVKLKLAKSAGK